MPATIPKGTILRFPEMALSKFCRQLLCAVGVPTDNAKLVGDSLVAANLRGVDSHGIQLLPTYIA